MIKAQKTADIRYRVQLKNKPWIVVYEVRSSRDENVKYEVTLVHEKVSSCTCESWKPCFHMRDVQAREDARQPVSTDQKGLLHSASGKAFSLLK